MPRLGFRLRVALFFVATIIAVQALTAGLGYEVARRELVRQGGSQLAANSNAFVAQMDDIAARVASSVQILSQDYGLRSAIGERDHGTVLSILRNHGRRVGATRMQLVGLDGKVQADTAHAGAAAVAFARPALLQGAFDGRKAAVVAENGAVFWQVVVPIYAPQPAGLVVASVPIDDKLLSHMQELSTLPRDVEMMTRPAGKPWSVVAHGGGEARLPPGFFAGNNQLPDAPVLVQSSGREFLVLARGFPQATGDPEVAAVLGYSLDDALRPYRSVWITWAGLLVFGLVLGVLGSLLIARSVSRPVEMLATAARRIEAGDYRPPEGMRRTDEIGQLAASFQAMTAAIGQREQRIREQALHDAVTGLPNRVASQAAIDRPRATSEASLMMLGITRLPDIIKTVGHGLGDRLMHDAGSRLSDLAGSRFVGRVSDTQFVLWLPDAGRTRATELASRLLDALGRPFVEGDFSIDMGPAIGIACAPGDGEDAATLLRHAEVAQFAAAGSTRGLAFYDAATDPHRPDRLSLMGDLREAIDQGQLTLHYQPKLDLASGRVTAAEALIRWQHPRRGPVPPDAFIGVAEETGNISRLTRWVVNDALARARAWIDAGHRINIAVNLSVRDLEDVDLTRRIGDLAAAHGVPTSVLTLEVTESAVIADPARALQELRRLADLGFKIAVDDFGVGQSSFAYLRQMPVHELKIDKTFIRNLSRDEGDRVVVRSIVDLSHRLGLRVTAEGAEDAAALDYLREVGCDCAQGFHIAAAMPAQTFAERFLVDGIPP
ncbi:bifunctional diguanylate cyclase/phosphodiesterase [Pinirhizobacter sp.]|jgi:diguanylate cyclase (GGDEF)-like protein|uniref:bifunctional diguanylate cyclase/phosphodiesterase n=1 Tax=Pinirhizobacter sp. TaxID=2950432 RepID=UPI002F417E50